jgi:HD-GYP domain-containing protein (c-di-GMP phosphodiesterase class II)
MATAAPQTAWADSLDPDDAGVIGDARVRKHLRLGNRDRWTSLLIGGGFVAAAVELALHLPSHGSHALWAAPFFVVLYAFVSRVEFEVGSGAALPTQIVLVPMLFALPPGWVPLCVAVALLVRTPKALWKSKSADRVLLTLVSSWHAVGPAVVIGSFGTSAGLQWSSWPVYAGAFAAQCAADLGVSTLRNWAGLSISPRATARYLVWAYAVDAALAPIGLAIAFAAVDRPYVALLALPLVGLLSLFARERGQRIDAALELGHAYRGTALLLGDVVEADDAYTGEHSRDVVSLTVQVCERLGLDARQRRTAEFTALLHDVGKIRIPGEIINKAGPLDPDERRVIETHTVEGEAMLSKIGGLLGEVGSIVRSCHERWDGGGYPDGLAGEKIPLIARIVCCTDAYSAMTTDRPYRAARTPAEAVAELRSCAGSQFDPRVVDAVVAVVVG